jgi:hypothetical protein
VDHIIILGQEEIKYRKKISLFCDLNSNYSGIDLDLKLWNINEKYNIFFVFPKLQIIATTFKVIKFYTKLYIVHT